MITRASYAHEVINKSYLVVSSVVIARNAGPVSLSHANYEPLEILPDPLVGGWLGHVLRLLRQGRIGDFPDEELLSLLEKTERRALERVVGHTGPELLRRLRLDYALWLVSVGETVARSAQEAGFYDSSHLTRACQEILGLPPGKAILEFKKSRASGFNKGQ